MQNNATIYPCPFSKRYGIPIDQAWLLLNIFFMYRFVLVSLILILDYSEMAPSILGIDNPAWYRNCALAYFFLSIIAGVCIFLRKPSYPTQAQLFIFTDIAFITALMHFSGGITSGLGMLLTVSTAAGGLLIGGRCAMVFAAIATTTIFSEQIYAHLALHRDTAYTYTGVLGAAFFTIALLSYILAKRTEQSELVNLQHKQTIVQLQELNHYIIQHLQSGIIIVDSQKKISMGNQAAMRLLKLSAMPQHIADISQQMAYAFENWQFNSNLSTEQLRVDEQTQIQIGFNPIKVKQETLCMVILEDINLNNQRLQQGKLASLGRLTASIAHEIRNPLGAISHAGQLLSESPGLNDQDHRFTEIIATHCQRVNKIIDDILQLSKRKNSQRQSLELVSWLDSYREQFIQEQQLHDEQIKLQIAAENINILFDHGHLKQILDNLCLNALKYGLTDSGHFIIRTTYDRPSQSHMLDVIDDGPGITEENRKHLFEPFFTTSSSGTGLGLYISSELAELNQAKLSYYQYKNKGSCFSLCISDAEKPIIEI